ncbi:MAG: histidinol-phosphate transaminase [Sedimentisphaerales bacterium]|nr:histidinol-phosphate transaminase [Sedimentisphaerales bacterium]
MSYFRDNIEQMAGYVPGFQPKAADVVKLNTNENPYPPSPKVLQAVQQISGENLRRYPDPSGTSFREAAAKINGVQPENIICCNGGDDLLKTAFLAFCDKTRPVAYPTPTYSLYPVLAKMVDCAAIEIPFDNEFNLPSQLTSTGAALTIICNPNAPSGSFISVDEIASLADEIEGALLIDEAYVDFADDNCTKLIKDFDNLIILRSMSKGYSLAGLRFGYGIAQALLIEGLNKVNDSYPVDAIAIAAATAAIQDQDYFEENVEKVKSERARLTNELCSLGFDVPPSSSNFLLARCKDYKAEDIYDKLVEQNIYVRYFNVPGLDDKLRITAGTKEQNDILISRLKEIVQ